MAAIMRLKRAVASYGARALPIGCAGLIRRTEDFVRSLLFLRYRAVTSGHIGWPLWVGRGVRLPLGSHVEIGPNSHIGDYVTFEVQAGGTAKLIIGRRVWLSHHCHIGVTKEVRISDDVSIGEFTSIRDTTHDHKPGPRRLRDRPDVASTVTIGEDAWVGRGCLVQAKKTPVSIGASSVVAANSVVTGDVPGFAIVAGAPARLVTSSSE
jgi:acetyltransferase-like isoleucine patch superfamily enzyme